MTEWDEVALVLGVNRSCAKEFHGFRTGVRTRAVIATHADVRHRFSAAFSRVVVKLYKGEGGTAGSLAYQNYHASAFHQVNALTANHLLQHSITGGRLEGVGPYSVLEFIDGKELSELLQSTELTCETARQIIEDILGEIWIPLWYAGLRFKDCHPGNFVLTPAGRAVMIDTEQMRKDVDELLHRPAEWSQRDKHEQQGLSRLPGLIHRVVCATRPAMANAAVLRIVRAALDSTQLPQALAALGRQQVSQEPAREALVKFMAELRSNGLIQ